MNVSYRYNDNYIEIIEFNKCENDFFVNKEHLLLRSVYDGEVYKLSSLGIFYISAKNRFITTEESIKIFIEKGLKED